jgi:O-antigen/teichoic acid export membrane protein
MNAAQNSDHRDLKKILSSIFGSGAMAILGMIATFFVGVQLARYMSADDFGLYSGVISVFFIAMIPPQLGMPTVVMRRIANMEVNLPYPGEISGMIVFSMIIIPLTGLVCSTAAAGVLKLYGWASYAAYGIGLICLYPLIALASGILIGFGKVTLSQGLEQVVRPLFFSVFLFAAQYTMGQVSIQLAMAAHIGALAMAVTFLGLACVFYLHRHKIWSQPIYTLRPWLSSGIPIIGAEIFRSYSAHIGILISGIFVATASLGDLRIALTIATLFGFPQTVANLAVTPVVARLHAAGERQNLQYAASATTALVATVQLIGFTILFFFGTPLITSVFGSDYADSVPLMLILVVGHVVLGMMGPVGTILMMAGQERRVFVVVVVVGIIQTVLSFILLPIMGVTGAAWAGAFALVSQGLLYGLTAWKHFGYQVHILASLPNLMRRRHRF